MFEQKYSTKTIAKEIDFDFQLIMWSMIDDWIEKGKDVDYIQIFNITTEYHFNEMYIKVEHYQEQPSLRETFFYKKLSNVKPLNTRIFVIDNGEYSTMSFADEC